MPPAWAALARGKTRLLGSHRGWDAGALAVARSLSLRLQAPLVATTVTRLLVDANRSPHNPAVFSELTRDLPRSERARLLARLHAPHWRHVRAELDRIGEPVIHLAIHSFTEKLGPTPRRFDVGLLYDPARTGESSWAARLKAQLRAADPTLRVRRNAPYRGRSDGLVTALRKERAASGYRGLEVELNQTHLRRASDRAWLVERLCASLLAVARAERDGSTRPGAVSTRCRPDSTGPRSAQDRRS